MKIKNRFTVVIPIYDQYEFFRQCFESLLYHIDVKQVIVVDDFSNPKGKLRQYEDYIDEKYDAVKLIKSDEYRFCYHCKESDQYIGQKMKMYDPAQYVIGKTSRGHRLALQCGVDNTETEFVLFIDADCIFLEKSKTMIEEMVQKFDENQKVMCMGQVAGLMSNEWQVVNKQFEFTYASKNNPHGGCPGSPVFACRMSGWKEHGLSVLADRPMTTGWALVAYYQEVFEKGFEIGNYPAMSNKMVFHAGGGIFMHARWARRIQGSIGMCSDTNRYGGRVGKDCNTEYYHGRYILDMTSAQYVKYLQDKYAAPFGDIQPPLDENLLHIAKNEVKQ